MGHGKLKKFIENESFTCLLQVQHKDVLDKEDNIGLKLKEHEIKGNWNKKMFAKNQPIVLEIGCGRGEYTINLARRNPEVNYIGIDIKGARLWQGAKEATENRMTNVAFLRSRIEFIEAFFAENEVDEIWLTFSDPQLKKENQRLTSPLFLKRYSKILKEGGVIHLKTDSMFLYQYTKAIINQNNLELLARTEDLYGDKEKGIMINLPILYEVQTFYEKMFLSQGYKITYLSFRVGKKTEYIYPEFDAKYWRACEGPRYFDPSLR